MITYTNYFKSFQLSHQSNTSFVYFDFNTSYYYISFSQVINKYFGICV